MYDGLRAAPNRATPICLAAPVHARAATSMKPAMADTATEICYSHASGGTAPRLGGGGRLSAALPPIQSFTHCGKARQKHAAGQAGSISAPANPRGLTRKRLRRPARMADCSGAAGTHNSSVRARVVDLALRRPGGGAAPKPPAPGIIHAQAARNRPASPLYHSPNILGSPTSGSDA